MSVKRYTAKARYSYDEDGKRMESGCSFSGPYGEYVLASDYDALAKELTESKNALLKDKWVSVYERLPEKEGRYDVTVFFPGANNKPWVSTGDFTFEYGFGQSEIIAWKYRADPYEPPLPEPPVKQGEE